MSALLIALQEQGIFMMIFANLVFGHLCDLLNDSLQLLIK
jgi:hypothetical protein